MSFDIRPLSFGEILDRSFRLLIDNALVLISIGALVLIPVRLALTGGRILTLIAEAVVIFTGPILQAALTTAIAEIYLGRSASIEGSYKSAWSILLPFIGTYLIFLLIPGALFLIPILVPSLLMRGSSLAPFAVIVLFILLIPVELYLIVRWALIGPIMIVERRFGLSSLKRSQQLVQGVWWRTIGILVAAALIIQVPTAALGFVWSSIPVLGTLLSALTSSVSTAYSGVVLILYYFDRRCRVEDFDLRLLAEQVGAERGQTMAAVPGATSLG